MSAVVSVAQPSMAEEIYEVPVTDKFNFSSAEWDTALGTVYLAWSPLTVNGQLMICGIIGNSKGAMRKHNRTLLRNTYLTANGVKVMRRLSHFSQAQVATDLVGQPARCKAISADPKAKFELGMTPFTVRG